MAGPKLKTVTRTQGNNKAFKEGAVKPKTFEPEFEEVNPLIAAFRKMVRGSEYDVCELAITTYIAAKEHGKKITAVPVFLVRGFHHGAILVNTKAGIRTPKDLEGKKVGVARGFTVTTGVWVRSVLQNEYGVDLSKVTWVLSGDEHVAEWKAPGNVVPIPEGRKIEDMLISGELVAAIGVDVDHPDIQPLIPNGEAEGLKAFKNSGQFPINHTVVIKDELLEKYPDLAADVFNTFAESKRLYVEKLKAGQIEKMTDADKTAKAVMDASGGADPLPYGIEPNRKVLEDLIKTALSQRIITKSVAIEDLFAPSTRNLKG